MDGEEPSPSCCPPLRGLFSIQEVFETYCEPDDVKRLISTGLSDADISHLIEDADSDLDDRLGGYSMSADLKRRCSAMLTAVMVAERLPESYTVGSVRVSQGARIESWRAKVDELVTRAQGSRFKVKVSEYQAIDEDLRYPE